MISHAWFDQSILIFLFPDFKLSQNFKTITSGDDEAGSQLQILVPHTAFIYKHYMNNSEFPTLRRLLHFCSEATYCNVQFLSKLSMAKCGLC
jgi:hypothetical protein